jgi:DNA-binding transcriptional LysR family regulator
LRNKRRVALTKAGQVFLDEARKLVVQAGHGWRRHATRRKENPGSSGLVSLPVWVG